MNTTTRTGLPANIDALLSDAERALTLHKTLKCIKQLSPAAEANGTALDSPAAPLPKPAGSSIASPHALPASVGESISFTAKDARDFLICAGCVDALLAFLAIAARLVGGHH